MKTLLILLGSAVFGFLIGLIFTKPAPGGTKRRTRYRVRTSSWHDSASDPAGTGIY